MKFLGSIRAIAAAALLTAMPALLTAMPALAQVTIPYVQSVNPNDAFQDIANGSPQQGNVYASAGQMAAFFSTTSGLGGAGNLLIGGDATTNLFSYGTTGSSVTTAVTYGGPNRWFYWSGASTAMTVSRDGTAADLPAAAYQYGFKMARTSGQTGVVQMCMAQEVESAISYSLQGGVAELDFHAVAGANMSAASGNITAYIIYGTGQNEGSVNLAYGLNTGGGGSSAWAGQTNAAAAVIPLSTSVVNRYAVIASVPSTATEIAVALCYTPVGTAGTNDYVAFSGVQLVKNASLAAYASGTGYQIVNGLNSQIDATPLQRRPAGIEALLQERYYYPVVESGTAGTIEGPGGYYDTTTTCSIAFPFPAQMFKTPTLSLVSVSATTFKVAPTTTPVVLATPFAALQTGGSNQNFGTVSFKTTTETQYVNCDLISANGSGVFAFNSEM